MRRNSVLKSSAFRTGLAYAALFGVSVLILFGIVYWQTAGYMERQLRGVVSAESDALVATYREGGLPQLTRAIAARSGAADNGRQWYQLLGPGGERLAGNISVAHLRTGWQMAPQPAAYQRRLGETDDDSVVFGQGVRLGNGALLFVGNDGRQLIEARELIAGALAWGLGVTLLLAAAGGAVMGVVALRRVEAINRVAAQIVHGDLDRRVTVRGTGDEFDILAGHLNRMLDRIQQLMVGMQQVSSDIAHDLRTPLAHLRQRLETARRDATSVEEYRTAADRAIEETDQIIGTFAALLRIAQIESGSRKARFSEIDLSTTLETVFDTYLPVAEESGHVMAAHIAPQRRVHGDRDLLIQLFANLIENALNHTPPGSRIDIALTDGAEGPTVTVADNGPGIPEGARGSVTQRFYRLETSRSTPGSGLGLSLVAAICELHGVALRLGDNEPGLRVALAFRRGLASEGREAVSD